MMKITESDKIIGLKSIALGAKILRSAVSSNAGNIAFKKADFTNSVSGNFFGFFCVVSRVMT